MSRLCVLLIKNYSDWNVYCQIDTFIKLRRPLMTKNQSHTARQDEIIYEDVDLKQCHMNLSTPYEVTCEELKKLK